MLRPTFFVALSCALGSCGDAPAAQQNFEFETPHASLYPDDTLRYWRSRYEPNIRYNLDELILQRLSATERQSAKGLRLDFRLRGSNDPMAYYVQGPVITISTLSVKFLDDLSIAFVWLMENGFSIETISYYADVLKYRNPAELPAGRYPPPLDALGIPKDALKDPEVDDASQKILKSAIVFILAHEVGHIVRGHSSSAELETRVRFETEADQFATDLFRRIGVVPAGIVLFFLANTHLSCHRGDFDTHGEWVKWVRDSATHPLSGTRLTALASELRRDPGAFVKSEQNPSRLVPGVITIADQIAGMAPLVDDTLLQRHAAIVGNRIPLSELRPRPPGKTWGTPGTFKIRVPSCG
jgi:hypothetical protein